MIIQNPKEYLKHTCKRHGFDYKKCASLGTAANMNYAAIEEQSFRDLSVVAVCIRRG